MENEISNIMGGTQIQTPHHQQLVPHQAVVISRNFFDLGPREMVSAASNMASVLKDVIDKQKMFVTIGGNKYVKAEGWNTLGNLLGIFPREVATLEKENGDYESTVELVTRSGAIIGRGSALCGHDERRWGSADRFARRSMAITRATGKAYRLGFAWILSLAGYEPTPAEEMPEEIPTAPQQKTKGYDKSNPKMRAWLSKELDTRGVPYDDQLNIEAAMVGKSSSELDDIIHKTIKSGGPE